MTTKTDLARREFLHLAHTYKPNKPPRKGYDFSGWYVSEKLDGSRAFWDGGLTRGMETEKVPWASVLDPKKPGEMKGKVKPIATGLWSRYGNPIIAPDWFLNGLPCIPLDGELFAGRGRFQRSRSIVSKDVPIDSEWKEITYPVYGSPSLEQVFRTGRIKNLNFHCELDHQAIMGWINENCQLWLSGDYQSLEDGATFDEELEFIAESLDDQTDFAYTHKQVKLPETHKAAAQVVEEYFLGVLDLGGEGLIIRANDSTWEPKRMHHMLKYKPWEDAEGTVVGFTAGRETDKGSKFLGMIGALILDFDGKRLELSGLTNDERQFSSDYFRDSARHHPGEDMPAGTQGKHFKVGDTVSFKYRELSDDGIPKEARYWRQRRVL